MDSVIAFWPLELSILFCQTIMQNIHKGVYIIKNSGHEINTDAPEQLSITINSFFNKV